MPRGGSKRETFSRRILIAPSQERVIREEESDQRSVLSIMRFKRKRYVHHPRLDKHTPSSSVVELFLINRYYVDSSVSNEGTSIFLLVCTTSSGKQPKITGQRPPRGTEIPSEACIGHLEQPSCRSSHGPLHGDLFSLATLARRKEEGRSVEEQVLRSPSAGHSGMPVTSDFVVRGTPGWTQWGGRCAAWLLSPRGPELWQSKPHT
jgi:hypothetical protein